MLIMLKRTQHLAVPSAVLSHLLCPEYPDGFVIAGSAEFLTSRGIVYIKHSRCVSLMDVYHLLFCV